MCVCACVCVSVYVCARARVCVCIVYHLRARVRMSDERADRYTIFMIVHDCCDRSIVLLQILDKTTVTRLSSTLASATPPSGGNSKTAEYRSFQKIRKRILRLTER